MHLFETHIPVTSTERSALFYRDVVGLEFAYRDPTRDIVFLWIGRNKQSILGLWGPDTVYGRQRSKRHFAIAVSLPELLGAGQRLNERQVATTNFFGELTTEPSVIGWIPAAQIYFTDPDGHVVEYITVLDEAPDASFIGSLAAWRQRA